MIELFKHQDEFLYSDVRHTGIVAGFGSGKSFVGMLKAVSKKMSYPGINVAYYLPTYGLIEDIAYPGISDVLDAHNVPYTLNKSLHNFITPFGKIIMRSLQDPSRIIGYEVGYSVIDEADILPTDKMWDVFRKALARNRKKLPDGKVNSLDFVSTPEGFKFLYQFFVKKRSDKKLLINARTEDNDTLPDDYIEGMMDSYTPEQIEAYLNGQFVNLTTGTVYRNYDRILNHSDREIRKGEVLHIGMDFNITNMNAVVHVIDNAKPIAVEEITSAYDTAEMAGLIKDKYPGHGIVIYPDASGKNRSTSGKSDIQILRAAGFTVKTLNKNPFVKDRVNAMNLALLNNKGERKYLINGNNCPVYTEALEQQVYKNGVPDKKSGFDHVCEAGGYFIFQKTKQFRGYNPMKAR